MQEEKIELVLTNFEQAYRKWLNSQEGQTSAYEYEKSFEEFMQEVKKATLQTTIGSDSKSRNSKKKVQTTAGELEISKTHVLSQTSGPFKMSPYLQTKVIYVGQKEIFAEGSDSLRELGRIEVGAKQIERVSHYWGGEFAPVIASCTREETQKAKGLHYVMVDGAMIMTREEKWKETKLGRIFPADELYRLGNEENSRGWIRSSNYTGHIGNCHEFFDKFSDKVDLLEKFICIGDGASWIWDWCESNYPDAVRILDYWHATERMWKFIKSLYTSKSKQEQWIKVQEDLLWKDQVDQVLLNVEQLVVRKIVAKEEQASLITYLKNNKDKMLYGTYKKNEWLVGSGPIESAHRTVIQKRLKVSGQRWTIPGAQKILNLRIAHKNNNWQKVIQLVSHPKAKAS